jgi:hypothetical protein
MAVGAKTGSEFFKTYLKQHPPDRPQEKELAGSDQAQYAHGPHDGGITFSITERQSSALRARRHDQQQTSSIRKVDTRVH